MTPVTRKPTQLLSIADCANGFVCIRMGKECSSYFVGEICTDFPGERAFECQKLSGDGGTYHVRVTSPGNSECDCLGFLRHGYCRHSSAILKLIDLGHLPERFGRPHPCCRICGAECAEWEGSLHLACVERLTAAPAHDFDVEALGSGPELTYGPEFAEEGYAGDQDWIEQPAEAA